MISDEAVEAAAKVLYAKEREDDYNPEPFEEFRTKYRDGSYRFLMETARAALEAAAPHLLSEVADEYVRNFPARSTDPVVTWLKNRANPYRSQA